MSDASDLRDFLIQRCETDFGLSDELLTEYIAKAKAHIAGRRLSWKVVATRYIREAAEGPRP